MKETLKKLLPKKLLLRIRLCRYVPVGLLIINSIAKRIIKHHNLNISVNFTSRINAGERITFHKDLITLKSFAVSGGCYFQAYNGIIIGKNFLFAPGVKIISRNKDLSDFSKNINEKPIKIGDNVWIGANAIILPGVEIGNNTVVGAGSVVTKSFGDSLVIAGNPAKIIKDKI
ncbi:MAG: DapH/DapD/GlmU-related protein [Candidatus Poribacteria bacterium]